MSRDRFKTQTARLRDRRRVGLSSPGPDRASTARRPAARQGWEAHLRARNRASLFRRGSADPLLELARLHGILASYVDMEGKDRTASVETLEAILRQFGAPAGSVRESKDALREFEIQRWRRVLPRVIVMWDGEPAKVTVRLAPDLETVPGYARIHLEDGRATSIPWRPRELPVREAARIDGATYVARELVLHSLPFGYHWLEVELRGRVHRAFIISARTRSYQPPGAGNRWGLFCPMYALHSGKSWGAGNLADFSRWIDWSTELRSGVTATLPLLASFLDSPVCEPSPYSPASRLFWNEFYLDIESIPEFTGSRAAKMHCSRGHQAALSAFRKSETIDYQAQMAARRKVLDVMAKHFFSTDTPRRNRFEAFLRHRPLVCDYALFRAACERCRAPWQRWEERMRHGKLQPGDYSQSARQYHLYVQWQMHEQMSKLVERCREDDVWLNLDLPLGVHPSGYDVWRERDSFACPISVGAPPDMFFRKGQNWGFPPLHPQSIRDRGYGYLLEYLRFQMRHAGLLRIDHIAGLHRLYWIPQGFPADQGAYVSYAAEELQAILSLESHRHRTVLAGENLGTVPPEVNAEMRRRGMRKLYVLQFEKQTNSNRPVREPSRDSIASLNTHDTPLFAAFLRGLDLENQGDLGLLSKAKLAHELGERREFAAALSRFLARGKLLKPAAGDELSLTRACLEWLAGSPAEVVMVSLEDLWGEVRPQNVPGTCTERPNWRRKARWTLEQICGSEELREWLRKFARVRRGRSNHG